MITKKSCRKRFSLGNLWAGFCLAVVLCLALPGSAPAQSPSSEIVAVAKVIDGATVQLADGRLVRLGGVAAAPVVAQAGETCAEAERAELERLVLGQKLTLATPETAPDWSGHIRAILSRESD